MRTIELISNYFNVTVEEVKGVSREGNAMMARLFCYKYLVEYDQLTLAKAAKAMNKNQHATVISGVIRINGLIETDKKIFEINEEIKWLLDCEKSSLVKAIEETVVI